MKNINMNRHEIAFYPCGIKIQKDKIFDSPHNLGMSLAEALTGIPAEDLELGRSYVSIRLGCFSLVGVNAPDGYEDDDKVDELAEDGEWGLCSAIGYELRDSLESQKMKTRSFPLMFLNIDPKGLLSDTGSDTGSIQLFGMARLLRKLRTLETRFVEFSQDEHLLLESVVKDGIVERENDAILTPSEFEFELFRAEQDTERKFRILLNMITTFASTVSCKLMYWGNARPSLLHLPAEDVSNEMMWAKDGVGGTFLPSAEDAQRYLKANGLKHKDVDSYIQELIWGEARCS